MVFEGGRLESWRVGKLEGMRGTRLRQTKLLSFWKECWWVGKFEGWEVGGLKGWKVNDYKNEKVI